MARRLAVIAIGGNSLIKDKQHQTVEDQYLAAKETCYHIADMIEQGWDVAIGHGNGPQVGFILRRSEIAAKVAGMHEVPLDVCGADSQGAIGYALQQNLHNDFARLGMDKHAVTVVTQVEVNRDSPAFTHPSKPIGSFMDEATARERAARNNWHISEEPGRGWRRVVASPEPLAIVELEAIRHLVEDGYVVTAVGGGGIPVVRDAEGDLQGVEAVIDKDLASALLASRLGADLFVISTDVRRVYLDFGKPSRRGIDAMTLADAKCHLAAGQFGAGNMAPKITAIVNFLEAGGRRAIVTCPADLEDALGGAAGTTITRA